MFGVMGAVLHARFWHVFRTAGSEWELVMSSEPAHGHVLRELAADLATTHGLDFRQTSELDEPGLRLEAAGCPCILSWSIAGDPGLLVVFEAPDADQARRLVGTSSDDLARAADDLHRLLDLGDAAPRLGLLLGAHMAVTGGAADPVREVAQLIRAVLGCRVVVSARSAGAAVRIRTFDDSDRPDEVVDATWPDPRVDPQQALDRIGRASGAERLNWVRGGSPDGGFALFVGTDEDPDPAVRQLLDVLATILASVSRGEGTFSEPPAVLRERARIASLLHEGATQELSNVALRLEVLEAVADDPAEVRASVVEMREATFGALDSMRRSIFELTPARTSVLDLGEAIRSFLDDYAAQWAMSIDHHVEMTEAVTDPEMAALVLTFLQEALTNVRKHAGTLEASVEVSGSQAALVVEVRDEGIGFDPVRAAAGTLGGQGLALMRERARLAGGEVQVWGQAGEGTRVVLRLSAGEGD